MFHVKQTNMEYLKGCPVCESEKSSFFLEVKDHFLTGELFTLRQCEQCGFKYLNPRPSATGIGKYYESQEYISHNAQKKDLFSYAYRLARNYMIAKKYRVLHQFAHPQTLLDIGCGTGEFLQYCRSKKMEVFGQEPTATARLYAQTTHHLTVKETLDEYGSKQNYFDAITLWHVLEHIHELNATLEKIKSMLKPGGLLLIAVPNSDSWDARKFGTFWAAYDVPRHLYHFSLGSLKYLIEKHKLRVLATLPQSLDAFYISLLSEKYRTGKSSWLTSFFQGLQSNRIAKKTGCGHSSMIYLMTAENR